LSPTLPPSQSRQKEAADRKKSLARYPINLLLIAAMQNAGRAGKAASTLLGALGLADAAFYRYWRKIEDVLGLAELEVAQEILIENRKEEMKGETKNQQNK
jgi:hypothetical protein